MPGCTITAAGSVLADDTNFVATVASPASITTNDSLNRWDVASGVTNYVVTLTPIGVLTLSNIQLGGCYGNIFVELLDNVGGVIASGTSVYTGGGGHTTIISISSTVIAAIRVTWPVSDARPMLYYRQIGGDGTLVLNPIFWTDYNGVDEA